MLLKLPDHPPLLELVDLDDGPEELEVVAAVPRELLERRDVLGEAGAAEADPGTQELRPDAVVEPHPLGDLEHVGAGLLADVGDLVDERDLGGQESVGGELDHLGAGYVGANQLARALAAVFRGKEGAVELLDRVAGPVAAVADHHAVGVQEIVERRPLLEELGAGDVAEALLALLGEDALDRLAGSHRDG